MDPLYVILAVPVAVAFCFLVILRKSLRRGWTRLRPQVNEWASLAMVALLEAFKKGIKDALKEVFKRIILTILREMTGFPKPCAAQGGAGSVPLRLCLFSSMAQFMLKLFFVAGAGDSGHMLYG
ncbi:hypothetical protein CLIM01_06351 [Colletotrichum limetticola]|uniref:Uncharacterized protein n=1 Tax=Colletotrichum limetticola TaxID=1209924 RepID=A0ABQ9PXK1_9PEZI|nr:hypothetical protein CLIM01_06351 [Colletotrichum limetticola]